MPNWLEDIQKENELRKKQAVPFPVPAPVPAPVPQNQQPGVFTPAPGQMPAPTPEQIPAQQPQPIMTNAPVQPQPESVGYDWTKETQAMPAAPEMPMTEEKYTSAEYFGGKNSPGNVRHVTRMKLLEMTPEQRQEYTKNQSIYDALRFQDKPDQDVMAEIKSIDPSITFSQDGDGKFMHVGNKKIKVFKDNDDGYPEFTLPLSKSSGNKEINWRYYSTPEGKLGAVKRFVKSQLFGAGIKDANPDDYVELGRDSTMTPILIVKKPFRRFRDDMYEPGSYYFNKPGISAGDIDAVKPLFDDVKFEIAGSAGTAAMKWWKAMGAMGAIGGGGEFFNQLERQETDLSRLLLMSVGAAGGEGLGRALSAGISAGSRKYFSMKLDKLARKISGDPKMKSVDSNGHFTDEFLAAMKKKGIKPEELAETYKIGLNKAEIEKLTPEQRQRVADFEEIGAAGTRGQIQRDYGAMHREAELVKDVELGGPLRARHDAQQQQIKAQIDRMITGARGSVNPEVTGQNIRGGMGTEEAQRRAVARTIYNRAKSETGNKSLIAGHKFDTAIAKIEEDYIDVIPSTIRSMINKFRNGEIPLTLKNIEGRLTKLVNKRRSGMMKGTSEYNAMNEIRHATDRLINDMGIRQGKAAGLYRAGRKEVSSRKSEFQSGDIIDKVLHFRGAGIADEKVHQKLLAASRKEMRKVMNTLSKTGQGQQGIKDMRATVLDEMKAVAQVKQGSGEYRVTEDKWSKLIKKYGEDKLKILFTKKQWDDIQLVKRVTSYQDFDRGVYNFSGTFSAFKNWIDRVNGTMVGRYLAPITRPMGQAAENAARKSFVAKSMTPGFKPDGINTFLLRLRRTDGTIREIPITVPGKTKAISGAVGSQIGGNIDSQFSE
jgi:hypothetical protein